MSWRQRLVPISLFFSLALAASAADDQALWREYGLVNTTAQKAGALNAAVYEMKDVTGALAAWEWLRSPQAKACNLSAFCSTDGKTTLIAADNYVVAFAGAPTAGAANSFLQALPNRKDTSLPAILTFIPRQGLVPNSARYVLGKDSIQAFAPELASATVGFDQGAEAQVAQYQVGKQEQPVRLALFYYPAPEMARLHAVDFKLLSNVHMKRSGVLIAVVFGGANEQTADTLLSRIEYEAKITWNDAPPPSPIKPLYQLFWNIIYLSMVLLGLCVASGLVYAGLRLYRRRYGKLEEDEAMTTLGLRVK